MNTTIGFGDGHTLYTVGTAFIFETLVSSLAVNDEGDIFNTSLAGFVDIQDFHLPASAIGIAAIHAEEFTGEEGRFIATGTSLSSDDGIFLVHDIFGHERDLNFFE